MLLRTCEETLENTGVAVFAYALLRHLAGGGGRTLEVRLGMQGPALAQEAWEPPMEDQQARCGLRGVGSENPAAELISAR